jgi:hypothetical protein
MMPFLCSILAGAEEHKLLDAGDVVLFPLLLVDGQDQGVVCGD